MKGQAWGPGEAGGCAKKVWQESLAGVEARPELAEGNPNTLLSQGLRPLEGC